MQQIAFCIALAPVNPQGLILCAHVLHGRIWARLVPILKG